jgi:hypothetical protein
MLGDKPADGQAECRIEHAARYTRLVQKPHPFLRPGVFQADAISVGTQIVKMEMIEHRKNLRSAIPRRHVFGDRFLIRNIVHMTIGIDDFHGNS